MWKVLVEQVKWGHLFQTRSHFLGVILAIQTTAFVVERFLCFIHQMRQDCFDIFSSCKRNLGICPLQYYSLGLISQGQRGNCERPVCELASFQVVGRERRASLSLIWPFLRFQNDLVFLISIIRNTLCKRKKIPVRSVQHKGIISTLKHLHIVNDHR